MRAVAEFAMRGRSQAVGVATIAAALPLLFWVSAAVVALTSLRKGWGEGAYLLLWSLLPAAVWLVMQGDPTPITVIVGTSVLALVLRATSSWVYTLVAGMVLGLLISVLIPLLLPELVAALIEIGQKTLSTITADLAVEAAAEFDGMLSSMFAGILGTAHLLAILGSLILARWWQAVLYNPGGFKTEFQSLRLPRAVALPLVLLMLGGASIHPVLLGALPVLSVPLMIAGLALVHGIVDLRKLSVGWLVAFYAMVAFVGPYVYILLTSMALVDSFVDFRGRIANGGNNVAP